VNFLYNRQIIIQKGGSDMIQNNRFSILRCFQIYQEHDNSHRFSLFLTPSNPNLFERNNNNESKQMQKRILFYDPRINYDLKAVDRKKIGIFLACNGEVKIAYAKLGANIFSTINRKLHLDGDDYSFNVMLDGFYIFPTDLFHDRMNNKTFLIIRALKGGAKSIQLNLPNGSHYRAEIDITKHFMQLYSEVSSRWFWPISKILIKQHNNIKQPNELILNQYHDCYVDFLTNSVSNLEMFDENYFKAIPQAQTLHYIFGGARKLIIS
jgi:hypothetical protein